MSSYLTSVLIFTGINLIAVLGMFLLMGLTGLLSFGQVGFMAIGAYAAALGYTKFGLPFGIGLLIGIVISLLVGLVIGTVTLKLKNDYFALATYGFSEVIKNVLIYFSSFTGGSMGSSAFRHRSPCRWSLSFSWLGW
jgi:branched-chain amino acid transport system permease protein